MKKYILILIGLVGIGGIAFLTASASPTYINVKPASNTSYDCANNATTTKIALIATTTARTYIRLTNTSNFPVYLAMGTLAGSNTGIPLTNATGTNPYFETTSNSLYSSATYCYSSSGTSTIAVTEMY